MKTAFDSDQSYLQDSKTRCKDISTQIAFNEEKLRCKLVNLKVLPKLMPHGDR